MRAVVVDAWMKPEDLVVREVPDPHIGPDEIGVEVGAAGCNFADTLMVEGRYQVRPPLPFVPGMELAGRVYAVGDRVRGFAAGDRVLAAPGQGGFAERASVAASLAHPIPDAMSDDDAASLPIVYPTSYAGLVDRASLQPGETLLVHAAAGGVGLAAVQIGKALGARVIATAGGAEKLAIAQAAGADVLVDYRNEDFVERVMNATDGRGADVIYDSVGGDTTDRSLKCIAWCGRLLVIGFAGGDIPSVRLNRVLLKNIALVGLHWRAYPERDPERTHEIFRALFDLHEQAAIRPLVSATYPLDEIPIALGELGSRRTHGKVIVHP